MIPAAVLRALAAGALIICLNGPAAPVPAAGPVTLVYVGADDCPPCRIWQHGDGAAFSRSKLAARLTFRQVKSASVFDILDDRLWPDDLRPLRARIDKSRGVPLWIVLSGSQVAAMAQGGSGWRDAVLPALRYFVARQPAAL